MDNVDDLLRAVSSRFEIVRRGIVAINRKFQAEVLKTIKT